MALGLLDLQYTRAAPRLRGRGRRLRVGEV